ncbi:unnamed protein product, partial [Durusdinium trenchii]
IPSDGDYAEGVRTASSCVQRRFPLCDEELQGFIVFAAFLQAFVEMLGKMRNQSVKGQMYME